MPGQSGNPAGAVGRAVTVADVIRVARRKLTKPAIETLHTIMRDPNAPASARVRAAEVSLERAWGAAGNLETMLTNASPEELERLAAQVIAVRKQNEAVEPPPD